MILTIAIRTAELKSFVEDLAVFGGTSEFREHIHVGKPNIGDKSSFMKRVEDILDRRWLTNSGQYVREFEKRVSETGGVKHCVAMCNGTIALELAIKALGLTGEVILPSFTFIATAHALQWQGIKPVFCDIDRRTHNLDPLKVEALITPRTTGILGVHLWGRSCDIDALDRIAKRHGLKLLFDAAHAIGCTYRNRVIGGFGDAEVFSFHATKIVNSLEGGAVLTNNDELARKLRLMKNFGFTSYDKTEYIGINGKMDEVSAAMGLTNLESLEEFVTVNRRNYEQYCAELEGIDGLSVVSYDEKEANNFQYIVLEIDESRTIVTRDQLVQILHAENVLARRYFYPGCHSMEPYRSDTFAKGASLPETERLASRVLCLPTGTTVSLRDIKEICGLLRFIVGHGQQVKSLVGRGAVRVLGASQVAPDQNV